MAEGVGFEPTNPCGLAVLKTATVDRSATLLGGVPGGHANAAGCLANLPPPLRHLTAGL